MLVLEVISGFFLVFAVWRKKWKKKIKQENVWLDMAHFILRFMNSV